MLIYSTHKVIYFGYTSILHVYDLEQSELTQRQKQMLDYVSNNPGKIKQQLVRYLERSGISSRKTVYKDLSILIKDQMIVVRKDKPNSQTHYLYINKDNLFLSTTTDLDEFKKVFFVLLDKAKGKYKELQLKRSRVDYIPAIEYTLSSSLYDIYKYFINVYILHSLFKWPETTKDKEILNKLNTTFLICLQEIQSKISEAMISVFRPSQEKKKFIESMGKQIFTPQDRFFGDMLRTSKFLGIDKEYEPVIDHLWRISFEYIDFGTKKRKQDLKNWRKVLQEYR